MNLLRFTVLFAGAMSLEGAQGATLFKYEVTRVISSKAIDASTEANKLIQEMRGQGYSKEALEANRKTMTKAFENMKKGGVYTASVEMLYERQKSLVRDSFRVANGDRPPISSWEMFDGSVTFRHADLEPAIQITAGDTRRSFTSLGDLRFLANADWLVPGKSTLKLSLQPRAKTYAAKGGGVEIHVPNLYISTQTDCYWAIGGKLLKIASYDVTGSPMKTSGPDQRRVRVQRYLPNGAVVLVETYKLLEAREATIPNQFPSLKKGSIVLDDRLGAVQGETYYWEGSLMPLDALRAKINASEESKKNVALQPVFALGGGFTLIGLGIWVFRSGRKGKRNL